MIANGLDSSRGFWYIIQLGGAGGKTDAPGWKRKLLHGLECGIRRAGSTLEEYKD